MRIATVFIVLLLGPFGPAWSDVESLIEAASAAAAAGDSGSAARRYAEALELDPENGSVHYRLGVLLMDALENREDAERHFERARDLGFQPLGAAYRLARLYATSGREEEALAQLELMADGGFGIPGLIEGEAEFESIEGEARFQSALARIQAARFPCRADERHHAFDFWIGDWTVTQNGQFAGENLIQPMLGHCVIYEQWTSASGAKGKSFNYYDPGRDHWRQIWISDSGSFIEFTGEARDGGIFYTAETINPADGAVTRHRFEFTQNGDGSVRQFWATSPVGDEAWTTIWDARYDPKAAAESSGR